MTVLAVDQGYHFCSVAVQQENRVAQKILSFDAGHLNHSLTCFFLSVVNDLCSHCGITLENIEAIAATTGPASFTGLRAVLAVLQGIAFARKVKVFTCTRLELQAFIAFQENPLMKAYQAVLDNQRGDAFIQTFKKNHNIPLAVSDVGLLSEVIAVHQNPRNIRETTEANEKTDTGIFLLKWIQQDNTLLYGTYRDLRPFYGHTPTFKKKFL